MCLDTKIFREMMYFERKEYLDKLISAEGNGMIKIITGIRRCGKSFLLFNIFCKHSDDEPFRFPLGERVDSLEEISRAEEQLGLTELTVNSCFSALSFYLNTPFYRF